jgi:hypothetical protein
MRIFLIAAGLWAIFTVALLAGNEGKPEQSCVEMTFEIHTLKIQREDPGDPRE